MGSLKQTYEQLLAQWAKLPARARLAITAVGSLGVVVALVLAVAGGSPSRILFSGLDPRDAASVVAALDGAKIPYQLAGGGTVISVSEKDVDRARLMLAEQDLPKTGNVGFEMFAEQTFGMTDFAQQVNYRRALQGELERTIMAIDAVGTARVHITQPRQAVFEDEKIAPTASVTIGLVQGREIGDRNVGAIRHLVASSVEGLEPGGVTVVDTKGNLLSRAGAGDDAAAATLDYENDLERDLERKLTRLLERTVGVGGAEVRVAADVDFSKVDTTEEVFDPEQISIRSESESEIFEGRDAARARGVAGAEANAPAAEAPAAAAGAGTESSRVTRSKSYEVNRTVVRTVGASANLKRLTVAVLVDGTYTQPEDGGEPVFNPRPDEELKQLQAVIENAIGFNSARGDRVKLASVPFRDRQHPGDLALQAEPKLPTWAPYALAAAGLLAVAVGWWAMTRRNKKTVIEPEVLKLGTTVQQAQAALEGGSEGATEAQPKALGDGRESPDVRQNIIALAAADPERTADILRIWIEADKAS